MTTLLRGQFTFTEDEKVEFLKQNFGDSLFDSSGFKSLEVRIREQQMAGALADIQRRLFDYDDFNEVYLDDSDGFDPSDPFSALEFIRDRQNAFNTKLAERQAELESEFAEFLKARTQLNANADKDDSNSVKATQSETAPQVGSGETSPAATT